MDPLSLSASIIAVLQLTKGVISYLNDVRIAYDDRTMILSELQSAQGILYILRDKATQAQQGDTWSTTLLSLCGPKGTLDQFKTTLELLEKKLTPSHRRKKIGTTISWPFQKGEIRELLHTIERQKSLLDLALQNDHTELSKAIKADVLDLRCEINDRFSQLRVDGLHENIRQWLHSPDPSVNQNKARRLRFAKTGTWFVDGPIFAHWKVSSGSFLWLYGIPGCGKSILSSSIIEAVSTHCFSKATAAVLYFYFDFNDDEKQRHGNMIRSFIVQLSSQYINISQALQILYSSCGNGERQPTHHSLMSTLRQMLGDFSETFLIIDALDECRERRELLEDIEELTRWRHSNLHILTTSRRETDIEDSIELLCHDKKKICIQSVLVNDDIRAYVRGRLQTDQALKRWRNQPKVRQEIENTLMDKADGMFRWAACQLDSLQKCLNPHGLRKSLASLPRTLDDTYTRVLCDIDEEHRQYAYKILQWLTYSARPLKLTEVAEVVTIDVEGSPRFDPEKRFPEPRDILTVCSSLISLEDKGEYTFRDDSHDREYNDRTDSGTDSSIDHVTDDGMDNVDPNDEKEVVFYVRLAHFSVKEYLISDRILQGNAKGYGIQGYHAQLSIQNDCLVYLMDALISPNLLPIAQFPLALYAARHWTWHARSVETHDDFEPTLSIEFFLTKGHGLLNWIRLGCPDHAHEAVDLEREMSGSPLYYASRVGLHRSVEILLDRGADVDAQGGEIADALQGASRDGNIPVVQMLLGRGADVNTQGEPYGNALQAAIHGNHIHVVGMLLDNGADLNAESEYYGDALALASLLGHIPIAQMLLENGAGLNGRNDSARTPLMSAVEGIQHEMLKMLLGIGADINAEHESYGSALIQAAMNGTLGMMRILLDYGADVHSQHGRALGMASSGVNLEAVQILLDNGADINAMDESYGSALIQASKSGLGTNVVQILLDNGADVNAMDDCYGSALIQASRFGLTEVVQILLDNGADVDAKHEYYGNALLEAASWGQLEVVQMLLDNGADVNAQHELYNNTLQMAMSFKRTEVEKLLRNRGAIYFGLRKCAS